MLLKGGKILDIKKSILDLVNFEQNGRYSNIAIEKLILTVLKDYLKKQKKEILVQDTTPSMIFDALVPEGFDNIIGKTGIQIKVYRHTAILFRTIYDTIGRLLMRGEKIDTLLLIIVNEVSESIKNKIYKEKDNLNFDIVVWSIDDIVNICSINKKLFADTYNNINELLIDDTVSNALSRDNENYKQKRNEYIKLLSNEYNNDNIVLFLGAGVSFDAKIATWDRLISKLFVTLIEKKLKDNDIEIEDDKDKEKILKEVMIQNSNSQLLQTRFLRSEFSEKFPDIVRDVLYENALDTSDLLEEVCQLCISKRGKIGIQAIITYNFDDLVEKNLKRLRVKCRPIYAEGMIPDNQEIGIYHVHGFLPKDKECYDNLAKSLLVFSEEGYHKLLLEPYNWANITQLNFLTNNTCIFIGLSLTDPNLRRLLEVAAQKNSDMERTAKHYAIMRRFKLDKNNDARNTDSISKFENINESLQELFFLELGVNIIWIDDFSDIPNLLKQIKDTYPLE